MSPTFGECPILPELDDKVIDALIHARSDPWTLNPTPLRELPRIGVLNEKPGDALHSQHMDALKRVIEMARVVGAPLVRIMTQKKE